MPTLGDLMMQDPQFPALERRMIARIGNAVDVEDAKNMYRQLAPLLPKWKFIIAAESGGIPGFSVNRTFSNGAAIRSLFTTKHVALLDVDTAQSGWCPIDYSIALDTQALSYLVPFLGKFGSGLPPDFAEVFDFISQDHVNVDALPYVLENTPRMLDKEHAKEVRSTMLAFERLKTMDSNYFRKNGVVHSCLSEMELEALADKHAEEMIKQAKTPEFIGTLNFRHGVMYAILLETVFIQIGSPQQNLKKKVARLTDFMRKELGVVFQREAIVAIRYFQLRQDFTFFGSIQKNGDFDSMVRTLKGMAWDYWHVHQLEEMATTQQSADARYFFPSILTFDKRYIDVLDACPLRAFCFREGESRPYPFYANKYFGEHPEQFQQELTEQLYSTEEALERRQVSQAAMKAKLPEIIAGGEDKLRKFARQPKESIAVE